MPPKPPRARLSRPESPQDRTSSTEDEVLDALDRQPYPVPIPVPIYRYRVLFSDGALVDFLAYSDHSGIRGDMLEHHYGKRTKPPAEHRIEGIAHLGQVYVHTPCMPSQPPAGPEPK